MWWSKLNWLQKLMILFNTIMTGLFGYTLYIIAVKQ